MYPVLSCVITHAGILCHKYCGAGPSDRGVPPLEFDAGNCPLWTSVHHATAETK